jgi:hypothetical protein
MNPTRKKARIITRFRYSAPIYRGKENATAQVTDLLYGRPTSPLLSEGEGEGSIQNNWIWQVRELPRAIQNSSP